MSKVRTVSRFALFLFVTAFATTAISGEARKPSGKGNDGEQVDRRRRRR